MIWLILVLLLALAAVMVAPSLFRPSNETAHDALTRELEASKHQLAQIDAEVASGFLDEQGAARARRAMERRILQLGERIDAIESGEDERQLPTWVKFATPAALVIVTGALYPLVGAPFYDRASAADPPLTPEQQAIADMTPQELEAMLVERINSSGSQDPTGYVLLGRLRMDMGKFDQALESYNLAMQLSGNDPQVANELQQARDYIAQVRGNAPPPSSAAPDIENNETANAIRNMSPEEQQAQIQAMVDGLAVRLEDNPDDLQGWLRLIRARTMLGQAELAEQHLATARAEFSDEPTALNALGRLEAELGLAD